jgi:hypothetical protein
MKGLSVNLTLMLFTAYASAYFATMKGAEPIFAFVGTGLLYLSCIILAQSLRLVSYAPLLLAALPAICFAHAIVAATFTYQILSGSRLTIELAGLIAIAQLVMMWAIYRRSVARTKMKSEQDETDLQ